ncbi:MAG TPA: SRPBCC family protein [Thermomonospora sp.]|nr:SRPBCC family protein [Thermomonospora sp.]
MAETEFVIEPGRHDIVMTRVFDAPPELVYEAYTDPEIVRRWMGPRKYEMVIDRWDFRPGGSYRYVHSAEGETHGFRGVFHDTEPGERIIQTFEWEGMPGHVCLETVTFEPVEGDRTKLVAVSVFQSIEDRDGMAASGMEGGASESMDRLAEVLAERR